MLTFIRVLLLLYRQSSSDVFLGCLLLCPTHQALLVHRRLYAPQLRYLSSQILIFLNLLLLLFEKSRTIRHCGINGTALVVSPNYNYSLLLSSLLLLFIILLLLIIILNMQQKPRRKPIIVFTVTLIITCDIEFIFLSTLCDNSYLFLLLFIVRPRKK